MDIATWWVWLLLGAAAVYFCGLALWTWLIIVAVAEDEHRSRDLWDDEPGDDEPPGVNNDDGGRMLSYRDYRIDRMPRGCTPRDVFRVR